MRNNTLASAIIAALLVPGLAGAVAIDNVVADADCNAWSTDVAVSIRSGATSAYLEYSLVLRDDAGLEMDRVDFADWVDVPATASTVYSFSGTWDVPLAAPGELSAHFQLYDIFPDGYNVTQRDVLEPVLCGAAGGEDPVVGDDPCRYDLGYWKNAAEWPAAGLELGGVAYDMDALRGLLSMPPRGDATVLLARQLIAAKLNMAGGAADAPMDMVAAADDYLAMHPVQSNPQKRDRQPAMPLVSALAVWNGAGCPDGAMAMGVDFSGFAPAAGGDKAAGEEVMNLGTLKSMFR